MFTLTIITLIFLPIIPAAEIRVQPFAGSIFTNHGQVVSDVTWARLQVPLSLRLLDIQFHQFKLSNQPPFRGTSTQNQTYRIIVADVKKAQKLWTDIIGTFEKQRTSGRGKRSILAGLAGGAIATLGSFLYHLIAGDAQYDDLKAQIHTVGGWTVDNAQRIQQIGSKLETFQATLETLASQADVESKLTLLHTTAVSIDQQVHDLAMAVDFLLHGTFSRFIASPSDLEPTLTALDTKARQANYVLATTNPLHLYNLPTTYSANMSTRLIQITIHIPAYKESHLLNLFKYTPIPVPLHPAENIFVLLQPDHEFLGLSESQTLFRTFTQEQLQSCVHLSQRYFCSDGVLQKLIKPTCLTALYSHAFHNITQICPATLLKNPSEVIRINRTSFAFTATNRFTVTQACEPQTSTPPTHVSLTTGTYIISTDPNCTLLTPNWLIEAHPQNLQTTHSIIMPGLYFNISDILDNIPSPTLIEIRKILHETSGPKPISQLQEMANYRLALLSQHTFSTLHLPAILGASLILIIIIYCIFRLHRKRNRTAALAIPQTFDLPMLEH